VRFPALFLHEVAAIRLNTITFNGWHLIHFFHQEAVPSAKVAIGGALHESNAFRAFKGDFHAGEFAIP
jgi:hypothetical protein